MAPIYLSDGLVGYYPLYGDTLDCSLYQRYGTLVNGVGYGAGRTGRASLRFNGSSTYVDVGSKIGALPPPATVALWLYLSQAPAWGVGVFPRLFSTLGQSGANWNGWEILFHDANPAAPAGILSYGLYFQSGNGIPQVPSRGATFAFTSAGWYHLAATVSAGTPSVVLLYVNGANATATENLYASDSRGTNAGIWNARIGGIANYAGANYFARDTMQVSDVRVYNRVLSPVEIAAVKNAPRFAPSRRVWVQLGPAAGGPTTWNDSVAETGGAADTPTAISTLAASTVETTSSADTPTAISTRLASVAETGSAVDSPDATTGATPGVAAETASAVDTPAAVSTRLAATAEIGSAAETPTAASTRLAAVTETTSSAESTDGVVPAGANSCAETASAADAVSCLIVTSGSIAEGTASATDVCAAGGIWSDFVAETATAVATQYVVEPISAIAPDVSKWIDNEIVRLGSSPIDLDGARIGYSRPAPRKPRL